MNQAELQANLAQYRDTTHYFYTECEKDSIVAADIDMEALKQSISYADRLIEEITDDVMNDLVPVSFYEHLQHDIEKYLPAKVPTSFRPGVSKTLAYKTIADQIIDINRLSKTYSFYEKLGFAQKNTVLVGANGCGKTSLANLLKKTLDVRDGIVIPAQKLLIIPKFSNTPNLASAKTAFEQYQMDILTDKVTFDAKEMDAFEYNLTRKYGSEMVKVIGILLGERQVLINRGATRIKDGQTVVFDDIKSTLDEIMVIWNELIEHRQLECDENNCLRINYGESSYDAHEMSDGERVIIYHTGRVLLAPEKSLIIVDEPEVHLHKSIANKLWDKLESRRKDCTFIYFTHDLDFASSRIAQKGWIKEFQYPNSWDIELLKESVIPEELQLKLLGSRKKILFCEGNVQNSIDRSVFEILFPNYTIQPVESCKSVITYTKAFNTLIHAPVKACGLIDRDFRNDEQLKKLEKESIYSYSVSEIENLFLVEDFIVKFAEYKNEVINIDDIKSNVYMSIARDLENQLAAYITSAINYTFTESHVQRADTKEKVAENFMSFIDNIKIDDLYTVQKGKIERLIDEKNYNELIKIVNNKGLTSCVSQYLKYKTKKDYIEKALHYLKDSEEGRNILRNLFPAELF
ncbi:DUF4435 domain-containing protein [Odoribacter lunatus]|uniref:DUF4435 domain-containing protein n=1 Tax=Odoribacter lunatus TaxID=2941335 RepID=UPI0020415549|nr:DUF4435 domain-containing protein [Odoribacter lunatus]